MTTKHTGNEREINFNINIVQSKPETKQMLENKSLKTSRAPEKKKKKKA